MQRPYKARRAKKIDSHESEKSKKKNGCVRSRGRAVWVRAHPKIRTRPLDVHGGGGEGSGLNERVEGGYGGVAARRRRRVET